MREDGLDSRIESSSTVPNDFAAFFATHASIRRVFFNDAKAKNLYRKHVLPHLALRHEIEYLRLPSTSPAHAGMPFAAKAQAWRVLGAGQ